MKPNVPYHLARLEGKITRWLYQCALSRIARRRIGIPRDVPFEVYAYSGENALPEQVASIRSFLANVGRPKSFVVLSDGSYTRQSVELLESIDHVVKVRQTLPSLPSGLPEKLREYLATHGTGKQLALIMSLPAEGPALYADSDVLFFPGASELLNLKPGESSPAFYLADHRFSGDERMLLSEKEKDRPANTGFLFLFRKLDWSLGLNRFLKLEAAPIFFTNQTIAHLCLHANGATPFDPEKFILQADDEFGYADRYANGALAIRHYVNPIRHKFWAALGHQMLRGSL
jgi:hypothetical protein